MEESSKNESQEPRKHLTQSRGGDIGLGIAAGIGWWVGGGLLVAATGGNSGIAVVLAIGCLLVSSLLMVGKHRYMQRFVIWQLVSFLLLPVVVCGLAFGACMMGGSGHW